MFDQNGKIIIGLERLILETIGFDFRTRYPQKLLVKIVRSMLGAANDTARRFYATAYAMCIDMYKTFVPVKRTTFSMAMAIVELTARLTGGGEHLPKVEAFAAKRRQYHRVPVMETMLDLLDLYVQHHKATKLAAQFDLARFIDIKIQLNNDLDKSFSPRFLHHCQKCEIDDGGQHGSENVPTLTPGSVTTTTAAMTLVARPGDSSVTRSARGQDGTMRFVFDPEEVKAEQDTVGVFFKEEFEEYEVEVEEPAPPPPEPRGHRDDHHEGGGGGRDGGRDGGRGGGGRGGGGGHGGRYRGGGGGHRGGRGGDRRGEPYGGYRGGERYHRGRGRFH